MLSVIDLERAEQITARFSQKRLLVVGDLMLDEYIWGRAKRISPEAPVPVVEVERESIRLGGAGNVANNLVALGAQAMPIGVVGNDDAGERMRAALRHEGVDSSGVLTDPTRPTTIKTRIIAHHQQVVRADRESRTPLNETLAAQVANAVAEQLDRADGLIVSDYDKGAITPAVLQQILPMAREAGRPVFLDPKVRCFNFYSPVTVLKPNQYEVERVTGLEIHDEASLLEAARGVRRRIRCDHLLITRGEAGMVLFSGDDEPAHVPTATREVYDVTGAGDTVMAALAVAYLSGATPLEAAVMSTYAASVVIGKVGTATATREELLAAIRSNG
jgi:D-beta-D-heptose 7-phosphate kinase/D-beta-D-heptose 1-phosphate adenosyltransferase